MSDFNKILHQQCNVLNCKQNDNFSQTVKGCMHSYSWFSEATQKH